MIISHDDVKKAFANSRKPKPLSKEKQAKNPGARPSYVDYEVHEDDKGKITIETPYANPHCHLITFTLESACGRSWLTDNGDWWSEPYLHGRGPKEEIYHILKEICAACSVKFDKEELRSYIDDVDDIIPATLALTNASLLIAGALYVPKGLGCTPYE